MTGFLPEKSGLIKMDVLPEISRLHFVEGLTISDFAKQFKLSRPTIRKHLNTVEETVYPTVNTNRIRNSVPISSN